MTAREDDYFAREFFRHLEALHFPPTDVRASALRDKADAPSERDQIDDEIETVELCGVWCGPAMLTQPCAEAHAGMGAFVDEPLLCA